MIVLLTKYHLGGHIKNYEMGGACGMYVRQEMSMQVVDRQTVWKGNI